MTASESRAKARLSHVGVMVPAIDPAVDWYSRHLGFTLEDRWAEEEAGMEWAHLRLGDLVIEFVRMPDLIERPENARGYHHLALTVPDCREFVAELARDGVEIVFPPQHFPRHDMDWAFIADRLGNVIEIVSYPDPAIAETPTP